MDFAYVVEHIVRMPPEATLVAQVSCVDTHVARVPPEATLSAKVSRVDTPVKRVPPEATLVAKVYRVRVESLTDTLCKIANVEVAPTRE